MTLYLVVLASVLTSIAQRGSKVTLSLYALDLGAGSFAVGLLGALFASFPLHPRGARGQNLGPLRRALRRCSSAAPPWRSALAVPALYPSLPASSSRAARSWGSGTSFSTSRCTTSSARSTPRSGRRTSPPSRSAARSPPSSGPRLAGFSIQYAGFREALLLLAGSAALPALAMLGYRPPSGEGRGRGAHPQRVRPARDPGRCGARSS